MLKLAGSKKRVRSISVFITFNAFMNMQLFNLDSL